MNKVVKLLSSIILLFVGVWLLLPSVPYLKPIESLSLGSYEINLVLWPNLFSLIRGFIPVVIFALGALLVYIEIDEYFASKSIKESDIDFDEDEMPAFEDVEYKDLECPECGEEFKTDIGLKVHRKVNHPESYDEE